MDLNEELKKRIKEIEGHNDGIRRRASILLWYFVQRKDKFIFLPTGEGVLEGWDEESENLMVFLGQGNPSFQEIQDSVSGVKFETLTSILTFLELRLGVVELARTLLEIDGEKPEPEEFILDPGQVLSGLTDDQDLLSLACHGIDVITSNGNPVPYELIVAMGGEGNFSAYKVFYVWALSKLEDWFATKGVE